jgi:IS30 family transposase
MPFPQFEQMSQAEDDQIAELYAFGYSQPEVARRVGRSRNAVRRSLKRQGIEPRQPKAAQREWLDAQRVKDVRKKPAISVFHLQYTITGESNAEGG